MTLGEELSRPGRCRGFSWLRLALALGIFTFHSVTITYGSAASIPPFLALLARLILPMFFALSGFLIASSLARSASLTQFILFRAVRLLPALTVVVFISMLLLGPLLTSESGREYFTSREFISYLGNIAGRSQYGLPGVFLHNPRPGIVNGSLWTIPVEIWCYLGVIPAYVFGAIYRRGILSIAVATLLLALAAGFYWGRDWAAMLPTGELVFPFLAGVGIFAMAERIPSHPVLAIGLFALSLVLTFHPRWGLTASLPLAYTTVWLGMRELPNMSGDYSYGLYLVGYPVQQAFVAVFPGHSWYQTWIVCLPASLGLAMLLWHFVECPLLCQKHRLIRRLPSPAQSWRFGAVQATDLGKRFSVAAVLQRGRQFGRSWAQPDIRQYPKSPAVDDHPLWRFTCNHDGDEMCNQNLPVWGAKMRQTAGFCYATDRPAPRSDEKAGSGHVMEPIAADNSVAIEWVRKS